MGREVVNLDVHLSIEQAIELAELLDGTCFDKIATGLRRSVVSHSDVAITGDEPYDEGAPT